MNDIEILESKEITEEELYKYIMKRLPNKLPLEHEIFAIRNHDFHNLDYAIYVDGYISLDAIIKNIEKTLNIEKLIQRNKDLEEIEKEHKKENGRLREELEKYQSLLAKSTTDRVVTSIKDNKKSNEDLEMLNEGWKIKLKEKIEEYKKIKNEPIRYTKVERPDKAIHNLDYCIAQNIIRVLQELLEESEK